VLFTGGPLKNGVGAQELNPIEASINEIAQQMCRRGILPIALVVISGIVNTRSQIFVHIVLALEVGRARIYSSRFLDDRPTKFQIRPEKFELTPMRGWIISNPDAFLGRYEPLNQGKRKT
jgi:hypothetical protein